MNKKFIAQIEPWIGKEEQEEVLEVLKSGWITEASKTKEFEELIVQYTHGQYVSVVTNGTVSLTIALLALGIKRGDEVIVPDFTMVATPNSVILAGGKPVFVDIEKETLCIDLEEVERAITPHTKAIMPVSLNGRSCDMHALLMLAKKYNLFVVEDAAQAFGSTYQGRYLGTFGDIGSFSFSTPKIITTGQGGALVTNNKDFYDLILRLKDFGRIDRNSQDHDEIGYNFKFTDILAAIGVAQMKKLDSRVKRKKEMYRLYKEYLKDVSGVVFVSTNLDDVSPWFIDILVSDPVALQKHLKDNNIGTRLFYPAIHTTKPYQTAKKFPNSQWVSAHGLWLPSSSFLSDSDIMHICTMIRKFYENK